LDAKVDVEVNSLHVKRIAIDDLVGYFYIVRVDTLQEWNVTSNYFLESTS
jgi:hypothetical protein